MTSDEAGSANDPLIEESVGWLRALHGSALGDDVDRTGADVDVAAAAEALERMAQRTPAWTEPHLAILDRWIERSTADETLIALRLVRATIDAGDAPRCPQVVGLDIAEMACDRAEWIDGNLHLDLVPANEDPERFTYFRVVGAEPRMWDVHGVSNARIESTLSGLNVRVPLRRAELSLIRSSY